MTLVSTRSYSFSAVRHSSVLVSTRRPTKRHGWALVSTRAKAPSTSDRRVPTSATHERRPRRNSAFVAVYSTCLVTVVYNIQPTGSPLLLLQGQFLCPLSGSSHLQKTPSEQLKLHAMRLVVITSARIWARAYFPKNRRHGSSQTTAIDPARQVHDAILSSGCAPCAWIRSIRKDAISKESPRSAGHAGNGGKPV